MKCLDVLKGVGLVGLCVSLFMIMYNVVRTGEVATSPNVVWGVCGLVSASYLVLWVALRKT